MFNDNDPINFVSLVDDYFDSSLVEIVKRVKSFRQIENITGTRGMSIQSIPDDIYSPESFFDSLKDYDN